MPTEPTQLAWSSDGKQLGQVMDALGAETKFGYHSDNLLYLSQDAQGRKTRYVYGDPTNPRQPTIVLVTPKDDLITNGDMEVPDPNSGWLPVGSPTKNERWSVVADQGLYSRRVDAASGDGIQSAPIDLVASRPTLTARVIRTAARSRCGWWTAWGQKFPTPARQLPAQMPGKRCGYLYHHRPVRSNCNFYPDQPPCQSWAVDLAQTGTWKGCADPC
jgi:hypothetical protein